MLTIPSCIFVDPTIVQVRYIARDAETEAIVALPDY